MTPGPRQRLESVDLLRGVIMIVMALDHVRDYFGTAQNPLDLDTTTPQLFFTRWVTYFCAPVFFLLTGTGASLSLRRRTPAELSTFLVTRGLWLIFVEIVPMRCLAYQFNADYRVTMLIVLWTLGWAMIVLALLVRLPPWVAATFGLVLIAGHNLLDGVESSSAIWAILHSPSVLMNTPRHVVRVVYPLIPWVGVTAIGYSLGPIYGWTPERRRGLLLRLGVAASLLFVALRAANVYGDPIPWSSQRTPLFTLLSFLGVNKYPPSLLFLLMTLGPALIFLWAVDRGTPLLLRPALLIGKVPFFYYVVHFFLIHLLAVIVCRVRYGSAHWMFESPDLGSFPFSRPPGWGFSLPVVYLIWGLVVLAMYPVCRWFAALKQRRNDQWLSYL